MRENLKWDDQLGERTKVLFVALGELRRYCLAFGDHWLIISPAAESICRIGHSRACIMQLARFWGLARLWMIDDSVPTSSVMKTATGKWTPKADKPLDFHDVLCEVEDAEFPKSPHLAGDEYDEDRFQSDDPLGYQSNHSAHTFTQKLDSIAIVGIPSSHSMEMAGGVTPQINTRTPTSMVLINLCEIPPSMNYDRRLTYKEDVLFAAQLIAEGCNVVIHRRFNFKDIVLEDGRCSRHRRRPLSVNSDDRL